MFRKVRSWGGRTLMRLLRRLEAREARRNPRPAVAHVLESSPTPGRPDRVSIAGLLTTVRSLGFTPGSIIDIGVSMGTPGLYGVWPGVPLCLVDPVAENLPYMEQIAAKYPGTKIFNVGASNRSGEVEGAVKSSIGLATFKQKLDKPGWEARSFRTLTCDDIVAEAGLKPPFILKIDTDDHELQILQGATDTIAQTELLIIELGVFNGLKKKMPPARMFDIAKRAGLVFFDIVQITHNQGTLVTRNVDMVFARGGGTVFRLGFENSDKPASKVLARSKQRARALAGNNPYIG